MASYVELIRNDILYHQPCEDASLWPPVVSQLVQSLQNELKLPRWLQSGSIPYTNTDLLAQLRTSDALSRSDLWDDTDGIIDDSQRCLHAAFNTALDDCARIRAILTAERATGTPFPKQSFLSVLVRNALSNVYPGLYTLDDVPVILPRHFSGESIPVLKYMAKSFLAPLIISICEVMPDEGDGSDCGHQPSDDEDEDTTEPSIHPLTMSEFLAEHEALIIHEEEEKEAAPLPSQFEAHSLAFPLSTSPPSTCHIPVLCMADEDELPVMMTSFLYQRRVWHISDPLVGVEFSKYNTTIKLYVGWLEADMPSDRVLPRAHLAAIGTALDLSSPSIALAVSRLLCSLESHIFDIRDAVRRSAGTVVRETQSHQSLSWRIDTDVPQQDLSSNMSRDAIIQWAECQWHSEYEGKMAPRKRMVDISLSGSATSKGSSQRSTSSKTLNTTSSPPSSKGGSGSIPEIREPHGSTDSCISPPSLSCSAFAATSEKEDCRVFRWMFDRRVVPQCIPSDLEFREEYEEMTGFIWPDTWRDRKDLPPVDAALEPYVRELLEGVAALEKRPRSMRRIPAEEFPADLRILQQSFSAIFQASRRAREKKGLLETVCEASWRVDHDRLLFDFFARLVQTKERDTVCSLGDHLAADLEDPLARPTLETTLRLPRNDLVKAAARAQCSILIHQAIYRQTPDLLDWVLTRGGTASQHAEELLNSAYVINQWSAWTNATKAETEDSTISVTRRLPFTGRCDALGRLLAGLPNVALDDINKFHLVVRAPGKTSAPRGKTKGKRSEMKPAVATNLSGTEPSTKISEGSLTVPDTSAGTTTAVRGVRYDIPSSSISTASLVGEQTTSTDSMDALPSKVRKLHIGSDDARLELPILAVEYKNASDNAMKGTNQLRMYLTASVKFLQAVGIRNVPVYGVQTDGPVVTLPVAVLKDDNLVYMFERLVERLDISTALGAWHYATILCRLAHRHATVVEERFERVKLELANCFLREDIQEAEGWTIEQQVEKLIE